MKCQISSVKPRAKLLLTKTQLRHVNARSIFLAVWRDIDRNRIIISSIIDTRRGRRLPPRVARLKVPIYLAFLMKIALKWVGHFLVRLYAIVLSSYDEEHDDYYIDFPVTSSPAPSYIVLFVIAFIFIIISRRLILPYSAARVECQHDIIYRHQASSALLYGKLISLVMMTADTLSRKHHHFSWWWLSIEFSSGHDMTLRV